MGKWVSVAKMSELEPGACRSAEAEGYWIALFNVEGIVYALDNCCPHAGGPLGEGTLKGRHVECPWHGWRFDVCTGERAENPAITASRYKVDVIGEDIRVWLPPETEGTE